MPSHARMNGGDSQAAGRARQRLKLAAIGYANARHGVDATPDLARAALKLLCQAAMDFVEAISGPLRNKRWTDLLRDGDSEALGLMGIAYAGARHGIDADVGMAREGLALLCQASISYVESLLGEATPKRGLDLHRQIGQGARP